MNRAREIVDKLGLQPHPERGHYVETYDKADEVPQQLRKRTLAARSFDRDGMMVERELIEGTALEGAIDRLFANPRAAYLHIHYAAPGCYAARVDRV